MKLRNLLIITAAALVLGLPLAAQTPEETLPAEEPVAETPAYEESTPVAEETDESVADESVAADDTFSEEEELPQTASPLALLALLGLAGAGSAIGIRSARRS